MKEISDHAWLYEIQKRFLCDKDESLWTDFDFATHNFLISLIETLNEGKSVIINPDEEEIRLMGFIKSELKKIKGIEY